MPRIRSWLATCASGACALTLSACPGSSGDDGAGLFGTSTGPTAESGTDDSGDDPDDSGGTGGTNATGDSSTTGGTTTTTSGNPTTTSTDDGTTGDPTDDMLDCMGDPLETLPIDSSGWIPRECTIFDIQGAWYCYDDGTTSTSCVVGQTPYENDAMCLSGTAMGVPGAWGGGVGVTLNETGGAMSMKMPYDAAGHDVVGVSVEIAGNTGGNPLRIVFTGVPTPTGPSPFVEVPGPGSYDIMLADALVPVEWMLPESGDTVDPTAIYDIQVQVVADNAAGPFDYCITELTPILDDGAGSGSTSGGNQNLPPYGNQICGQFESVEIPDLYLVSNNVWNDAVYQSGGSQCITALWDGMADAAGFITEPNFNVATPAPGSYPSVVYGWHWGEMVPGPYNPQAISTINAIPSQWSWDTPNAGRYNVAYDLWMHADPNVVVPNGGLELMIWTTTQGAIQPIGVNLGTVDLEGATWEVWYGSPGAWNTVTYRRVADVDSVDMDLLPFVQHAVGQGYAQSGWSLLGVEAGFEVWEGFSPMTTHSFFVEVL